MVCYQSSTSKQYSGDSYFREQDFIQTNPHGTLTQILLLSSITPASWELIRAFPKPRSPCDVFLAGKRSPAGLRGMLTADLNCRLNLPPPVTPVIRRRGSALKLRLPLRWSFGLASDSTVFSISEMSEVWVSALSLYTWW
jgi:hypothetical protein